MRITYALALLNADPKLLIFISTSNTRKAIKIHLPMIFIVSMFMTKQEQMKRAYHLSTILYRRLQRYGNLMMMVAAINTALLTSRSHRRGIRREWPPTPHEGNSKILNPPYNKVTTEQMVVTSPVHDASSSDTRHRLESLSSAII